jgi:hypothetical protein
LTVIRVVLPCAVPYLIIRADGSYVWRERQKSERLQEKMGGRRGAKIKNNDRNKHKSNRPTSAKSGQIWGTKTTPKTDPYLPEG